MQQILLIDDSEQIHQVVKALLSDDPVEIHSAFDAQYGLVLAESMRPDLILLDVEMPGVDGFETCRQLMQNPATAGLPVIFLTGRAETDETVLGLDMGAIDYVVKPFKMSELQSRVRAALRTSHRFRVFEEKSLTDPLTQLGSKAMFDERFAAEVALRIRSGDPLSCIVLDVDKFKEVNAKYGRQFGDTVLSKIGSAVLEICREEDVACRW